MDAAQDCKAAEDEQLESQDLTPMSIARRKTNDIAMTEFVLGTSAANSIINYKTGYLELSRESLSFLEVNTEDVRTLFTTLADVHTTRGQSPEPSAISYLMHASTAILLARRIVLIALAYSLHQSTLEEAVNVLCSVWMNAILSPHQAHHLNQVLTQLQGDLSTLENQYPALNLHTLHPVTLQDMRAIWASWNHCNMTWEHLCPLRKQALQSMPPRSDPHWQEYGSYCFGSAAIQEMLASGEYSINATLLHPVSYLFLEKTGPFDAFFDEAAYEPDASIPSTSDWLLFFTSHWKEMLSGFYNLHRSSRLTLEFWAGDCLDIARAIPSSRKFDYIETHNQMDYVGLWNLVITYAPYLSAQTGAFLQVENIVGERPTGKEIMKIQAPAHPDLMSAMTGLVFEVVQDETDLHIRLRWRRPFTNSRAQEIEIRQAYSAFLGKIVGQRPFPPGEAPLINVLPVHTIASWVQFVDYACQKGPTFSYDYTENIIDWVLQQTIGSSYYRNFTNALQVACAQRRQNIGHALSAPKLEALKIPCEYSGVVTLMTDLRQDLGGVGEPTLLAFIFGSMKAFRDALNYVGGKLYEHIPDIDGFDLQIMDSLQFNLFTQILRFNAMPLSREAVVVIYDSQSFIPIAEPLPVANMKCRTLSNITV
eukprot:TRINITY_DN8562_c0_g1_i1.p1 TRINITY_DN8562_c0_g1~~TRINITY_DN8562_c0_g1_i1.p1  ORF type:complete len:761 (+),score=131.17 TRINITY_DN8562_c0_g1_i1:335-2284(+)